MGEALQRWELVVVIQSVIREGFRSFSTLSYLRKETSCSRSCHSKKENASDNYSLFYIIVTRHVLCYDGDNIILLLRQQVGTS